MGGNSDLEATMPDTGEIGPGRAVVEVKECQPSSRADYEYTGVSQQVGGTVMG